MPLMTEEKKWCTISGMTRPRVLVFCFLRLSASALGRYFTFSAKVLTRFLVSSLMSGWSLSARDTVEGETPSILAISLMVMWVGFIANFFLLRNLKCKRFVKNY